MLTNTAFLAEPADVDLQATRQRIEASVAAETDEAAVARLANLKPMEYDRVRESEAERMKVRVGTLDKLVLAVRKDVHHDSADPFADVEPWGDEVDGNMLLIEIAGTVRQFVICSHETSIAAALWIVMTYLMDHVHVAPIALITSPEKRCGKSTLLTLLNRLVRRAMQASNITASALFRSIELWKPTLLLDEADTFMRENEELRGVVNAGHTRDSAFIVRSVGDDHVPTRFDVWGAKAIAGIGKLGDTIMDRSIVLELRRKKPDENTMRIRHAEPGTFETLKAKITRWAEDHAYEVSRARPILPESLNDRAADNWEPLFQIATVAGSKWPGLAERAALKLSGTEEPARSIGVELLSDIREIFEHRRIDRITSADLIERLCEDEEKPWATYNRGFQIKPRQIASKLREFDIVSHTIRIGCDTAKGYTKAQFEDAFARYLEKPQISVTPSQASADAAQRVTDLLPVTEEKVTRHTAVTPKPAPNKACDVVTDMASNSESEGDL